MTDVELLAKVKTGLSVTGTYNDATLTTKILAAKQYMVNAGITTENLETELGITALTVGVSDLWNLSPGEVKFSPAFDILICQLKAVSIPDA